MNPTERILVPRLRKLAILAATAAALCLPVSPALAGSHARPHHAVVQTAAAPSTASHLQFSAVTLGRENYFFPDQALSTRQRIDNAGFQGERVVFVWDGTSIPGHYELDAACNAAQVSSGQKVLMLNLRPDRNFWPADAASLGAFNAYLAAFDAKLFLGTGTNGQPCWPAVSPPQLMWMIGNEPNSHDFCNGDSSTSDLLAIHQVCAIREAMLLHSSYPFIQAQELTYGHQMAVVGGGLSSHDAPIDLLTQFLLARKGLGYKTCDMDYFGFHPYSLNSTDPYSGFSLEPKLEAMLKGVGCPLKVIYTEMGAETIIPGAPSDGYNYNGASNCAQPGRPGALCIDEGLFTGVYQRFIQIMDSQPDVIGFMNFELDDEQYFSGWQSGFYYFSDFPKPFVAVLRPILAGIGGGLASGIPK